MKVEFLQTADDELSETIAYYDLQSEGLGLEFAAEVKRALGRILQYPAAWTPLSKRTTGSSRWTNRLPGPREARGLPDGFPQ